MSKLPNREKYEIYDQDVVQKINGTEIDEENKRTFLKGNPFLYNSSNSNLGIVSIEEYLVNYDDEEKSFGEVVYDNHYSERKRKRFVKKTLKDWKKEYLKIRDETIDKNLDALELLKEFKTLKINIVVRLLLIIFLVINLFILMINNERYLYDSIFIKVINNVSIYLIVFTLMYIVFYNVVFNDFKKFYKASKNVLNDMQYHLARDYKKKYTNVKKYYIKRIKKNFDRKPYDIKLVGEGKSNLNMFNEVTSLTINKVRNFKNKKVFYIIIKYILVIPSILLSLIEIVYLIYRLIKMTLF